MHDPANELPRIPLPRTPVNKAVASRNPAMAAATNPPAPAGGELGVPRWAHVGGTPFAYPHHL